MNNPLKKQEQEIVVNNKKLFVFFNAITSMETYGGKQVQLLADDFAPLLKIYDPWEIDPDIQIAPVDFLMELSCYHNFHNPKQLWKLLKMCFEHKNAPDPSTWSHRLTHCSPPPSEYMYNDHERDVKLPWLFAFALGSFKNKVEEYASFGAQFDVQHNGLSPLKYLSDCSVLDQWFKICKDHNVDLVGSDMVEYLKKWERIKNLGVTELGIVSKKVSTLQQTFNPISEEQAQWIDWINACKLFSGYNNTIRASKPKSIKTFLQNEDKQLELLSVVLKTLWSSSHYHSASFEGALKAIGKVWNDFVPVQSPYNSVFRALQLFIKRDADPLGKTLLELDDVVTLTQSLSELAEFSLNKNLGSTEKIIELLSARFMRDVSYERYPDVYNEVTKKGVLMVYNSNIIHKKMDIPLNNTDDAVLGFMIFANVFKAPIQINYLFRDVEKKAIFDQSVQMLINADGVSLPPFWVNNVRELIAKYTEKPQSLYSGRNDIADAFADTVVSVLDNVSLKMSLSETYQLLDVAPEQPKPKRRM